LAVRLHALRPSVRVLYASGYADAAIVRHGILEPGVAFIQKPFSPTSLLKKIREVLDGPQPELA
jgi:FixJ family two-component response regulator